MHPMKYGSACVRMMSGGSVICVSSILRRLPYEPAFWVLQASSTALPFSRRFCESWAREMLPPPTVELARSAPCTPLVHGHIQQEPRARQEHIRRSQTCQAESSRGMVDRNAALAGPWTSSSPSDAKSRSRTTTRRASSRQPGQRCVASRSMDIG